MKMKAKLFGLALTLGAALVMSPTTEASDRPTIVRCGPGTHAAVRYSADGVRHVTCARNTSRRNVFGFTGRTVAACGAGTHRVIHHPVVNGRRIRSATCVAD